MGYASSGEIHAAIERLAKAVADTPAGRPDLVIAEGQEWRLKRGVTDTGEKRRWYECQLPSGEVLLGPPETDED